MYNSLALKFKKKNQLSIILVCDKQLYPLQSSFLWEGRGSVYIRTTLSVCLSMGHSVSAIVSHPQTFLMMEYQNQSLHTKIVYAAYLRVKCKSKQRSFGQVQDHWKEKCINSLCICVQRGQIQTYQICSIPDSFFYDQLVKLQQKG